LTSLFDNSFDAFTKHFPNNRINTLNFSVGNNAGTANVAGSILDSDLFNKNKFSLENIQVRTGSDGLADPDQWLSASYVRDGNITPSSTNKTRAFEESDLGKVANTKFAKFTMILQGGFNGVNIFNREKKNLTNIAARREYIESQSTATQQSTIAAYRKAIDLMASKTDVDIQLLALPGIRHPSITDYAIQKVEDRFDAMYIMDIEEVDQLNNVITSSVQKPNVQNTVVNLSGRSLNSSFAAAYFPDVIVTDPTTKTLVQVPPSVAVLGAYSFNDKVSHPWFAPAGYARGALNSVELPSVKLNRTNLDDLYGADINPITEFPNTGVTIWGQKTLLASNSALDRINVRRLLIDVRRKVRSVANSLLFEPNREETLDKFNSLVNPILQRVQEQNGVDRYKVIIDTTTTTQADVENNTIRGKVYLQPTRSIEFVSLDFVVTNAGANI
jgi:phage tail sheath protein FI